jgi:hypothetical protein
MASIISAGTTSGTALNMAGDTSGVLQLATNGSTTALTIDTSQNVGIGTTTPVGTAGVKLDVRGSITGGAAGNGRASLEQGISTNSGYLAVWNTDISTRLGYVGYATLAGSGTFNIMSENSTNALTFGTNNTEQARITAAGLLQFNSGYGSVATAFGCRAWVNFNGTGTVAIRASGNVTSITDNGTGDYTVNFTTSMPDANYAPAIATQRNGVNSAVWGSVKFDSTMATSNVRIATVDVSPTAQDPVGVFVSIFR